VNVRLDMGLVSGLTSGLADDARLRAITELRRRIEHRATTDGVLPGSAASLMTARRP
jgi:hypothetical protein